MKARLRLLRTRAGDGRIPARYYGDPSTTNFRARSRYNIGVAVMVLAAGLGTRLAPLSTWTAKPLVPVGDRPMLAHVLSRVRGFGGKVVVNAHHHAEQVRAFLQREAPDVLLSDEKELLGTAGGIHRARALLGDESVLVWNADILARLDVVALRSAHEGRAGRDGATLVVLPAPRGEGNVGIDARGNIVRLRKETVRAGEASGGHFLGIHVLGAGLGERLPERGGLIEDAYLLALARGATFVAWETTSRFHDIGTLATYLAANLAWLETDPFFVGPRAKVAKGVTLVRSVVGEGAIVDGEGKLEGSVVWPGAHAHAPLDGWVVTPFGSVRA
jgi:mannose-1-phosphate guanylyltransferase